MKKKLALLMAAIMTVAMVPMTAFAATTKINAVDQIKVAVDGDFTSRVELKQDELSASNQIKTNFDVDLTLENGKFSTYEVDGEDKYVLEKTEYQNKDGVIKYDVINDTTARLTIWYESFNSGNCTVVIPAKAVDAGDVVAVFSTNETVFADAKAVIANAVADEVIVETAGVVTFVEDGESNKKLKDITITGAALGALTGKDIVLKLKGDYEYDETHRPIVTLLNDADAEAKVESKFDTDKDELTISFPKAPTDKKLTMIKISGIYLNTTKKTGVDDVAKITVTSKDFDSVTLEVAKMVAEAVTYTVEDDDLPTIWAGKNNTEENTLKLSIEENTGDILNTSRKATFTFPEGIEVVGVKLKGTPAIGTGVKTTNITDNSGVKVLDIDENVVTIRNYYTKAAESNKTDMDIEFVLNAAPTFDGDVKVTLGGEFDDVEFTVATVKAPYTIEAKTSEVLIDYRYVPVNEIVITEAEEGLLEEEDVISLKVEKMEFEDAGSYEVTEGDIEVDVDINNNGTLDITVEDDSTEASTIVISGLELYLDRTLPVGGYALTNEFAHNILWENSVKSDKDYDGAAADADNNGLFKYKAVEVNDSYVEVVTQARDQDDYTTNRKIVITIGATTMAVGTETVTLDAPAYINAENYTELPLRAVSEAFGATVAWDDASRTVTVMMGQRIVSMTIGSKTMYINGTPVAMNTAPEITADRTFVPVRDLANALGISKIDWNEAAATVTLN